MKIKRFVAPDMRRAMRRVREEQGPDAVILSNRRIDNEHVEIVAAVDYDASLWPEKTHETAEETHAETTEAVLSNAATATGATWANEPSLVGMKEEVASLRRLLECQLASLAWNDTLRRHPVRAAVARELSQIGLAPELARSLATEVTSADIETAVSQALCLLEARLPTADNELIDEQGVIALVGPTGVGKTTTIAKLAARYALKHGTDSLALLTTDAFRIGAQEQLMSFARILGVGVQLVRDGNELRTALGGLADKRLVLIDSAGMSQRDTRLHQELTALRAAGERIRVLLTLSCHTQTAVLDEIVQGFGEVEPSGCVLTKLDEAASLGGAMSILIRHNLPLAYATDGQRVPEDLHWARSKRLRLVERATRLVRRDQPEAAIHDTYEELAHA